MVTAPGYWKFTGHSFSDMQDDTLCYLLVGGFLKEGVWDAETKMFYIEATGEYIPYYGVQAYSEVTVVNSNFG